ncbi:MAG TPA: beta-galactosidase [Anaerolineae bacterium]|nr:beta-galactosidase [Anaerolineae bacterium]HOQ98320.1 beta-galactosidase [Anaerolineae bacterium]HPL27872.1 beta-galactosidase [Anaerolineae bacterium]
MPRTASATRYAIQVDGHDLFLFAGELPYARLPRRRWGEALAGLRAAHLNAAILSVPWSWHEPEEGEFDLGGESHPQRDLCGALALCAERGVYVILRPGPHIGSAWPDGGIPRWLLDAHPDIVARDARGAPAGLELCCPSVTYLHPVYQAYVAGWYQALLPLLRCRLITEQGTVVAVELDHRPCYWQGLQQSDPLAVDYSPWAIGHDGRPGLYQRWLAAQYGRIERLNQRYRAGYASFAEVQPPRRLPAACHELPWFSDWRRCKMDWLNQHLEYLYDWLRDGGVDVPLVVLDPYQSPLAARHCADYFRARGKPVLVAHTAGCGSRAPASSGAPGLGYLIGTAELARRWVKGVPLPPANLATPEVAPARLQADGVEALAALEIGHGLNALGLAPGAESSPQAWSPGAHGTAIRRLGQFLETHGERLVHTAPLADVALGWYEPYEDCARQGDMRALGWRDDYRRLLVGCSHDGPSGGELLELMALSGLSFAMLDLQRDPLEEWLEHPQLWVLGLDFMAAAVQRELISYVRAGGSLVMLPRVPYLDEHLQPCMLLEALFPARPRSREPAAAGDPTGRIVALRDHDELYVAGDVDTFDLAPASEALAWERRRRHPCAYRTAYGRGTATLLGFVPAAQAAGPVAAWRFIDELADHGRVRRHAASAGAELLVVERATLGDSGDPAGYLFVVNPSAWPVRSRLTYTNPRTGQPATLPHLLPGLELAGHGALMLCLEAPIPGSGLTIAYSTSQVQGWVVAGDGVTLTLHGSPHTMGELALRPGPGATMPSSPATRAQRFEDELGELALFAYPHHQGATMLRLRCSCRGWEAGPPATPPSAPLPR